MTFEILKKNSFNMAENFFALEQLKEDPHHHYRELEEHTETAIFLAEFYSSTSK